VYHLAVFGEIEPVEIRRIMKDATLINQLQFPPAKYLLCRGSDLGDVTTKTKLLSKHPQVREAYVTLNREQVVNTNFIHTLLREKINQVKKN
jgi:hypothetical protein